jgi:hypothetical protein
MDVRDLECDLGHIFVPHEACHARGFRIPVEVPDEDVVGAVDTRERRQFPVREPRLRAAEAPFARAGAEAREERRDRFGVSVRSWRIGSPST